VLRTGENEKLMLTAAHVVGSLSAAHALDERHVLLRTGVGAASSGDPIIGEVIESHPPEPCATVELDACLVRVRDHVSLGHVVRETITSGRARDLRGLDGCPPRTLYVPNTPQHVCSNVSALATLGDERTEDRRDQRSADRTRYDPPDVNGHGASSAEQYRRANGA
jgi:hypothetical protein